MDTQKKGVLYRVGILEIVRQFLILDQLAFQFYYNLSQNVKVAGKIDLWQRMQQAEVKHGQFWAALEKIALQGDILDLFESPERIVAELDENIASCRKLVESIPESIEEALKAAVYFEYNMLHPRMAELFEFSRKNPQVKTIDDYEEHILELLTEIAQVSGMFIEIQLFGNAMLQLWRQFQRSARLSAIDYLTGIYNRRGFFSAVTPLAHLSQRNGSTIAIIMFDIDNFKRFNDVHGHQTGDKLLGVFGEILSKSFRTSDVVGRYGGDEFVAFLPAVDPGGIVSLAERIRYQFEFQSTAIQAATVSIGIVTAKLTLEAMGSLFDVINRADKNLYEAKKIGKNRIIMTAVTS